MNDLISIIIPVYNVEAYLKKCVDSVLAQTYTNIEIILVDDGSTDNSPVICDEYASIDSRIKAIHKPNGGVSSARNAGLDCCKGEMVCFVDSDDSVLSTMLETLYSELSQFQADIVISGCAAYDENGVFLSKSKDSDDSRIYTGEEMLVIISSPACLPKFIVPWNKLIRKQILRDLRFTENLMNEDEMFSHHLYAQSQRVKITNQVTYKYLVRPGSATTRKPDIRNLDIIEILSDRANLLVSMNKSRIAAGPCLTAINDYITFKALLDSKDAAVALRFKTVNRTLRTSIKKVDFSECSRNEILRKNLFLLCPLLLVFAFKIKKSFQ